MSKRPESGGTLAFIAVAALIIIAVGVIFFLCSRLLGGGQEAQQATDSGNLNIAKKSLLSPTIDLANKNDIANIAGKPEFANEFFGCTDPALTNGANKPVDLQYYNKVVGKAFLVAMNAAAEGTAQAKQNAQEEIALVEGKGGVGEALAGKLAAASNTNNFFKSVAQGNSIRMLNTDGSKPNIQSDSANYNVGYMLQDQQAPSNLFLKTSDVAALIPPGAPAVLANQNNAQTRGNKQFLCGYHAITIGNIGSIQFVPMRPGEQPHLVTQKQFIAASTSPIAGGPVNSEIPPNCFMSTSLSRETHTDKDVSARSSAIVGVVDTTEGTPTTRGGQFPPQIPGFILIDNSLKTFSTPSSYVVPNPPAGLDKYATTLMGGIVGVKDSSGTPHFDPSGGSTFTQIKAVPAGQPVPSSLGSNIIPALGAGSALDSVRDALQAGNTFPCNNTLADSGDCKTLADSVPGANNPTATDNGPLSGLMPIEALKQEIINVRATGSGPGCATVTISVGTGNATVCGALKQWNPGAVQHQVPFGQIGTLSGLLGMMPNGATLQSAIDQRLQQMAGHAKANFTGSEASSYNNVMNVQKINPGQVSAIFFNVSSDSFQFTTGATPQSVPLPAAMVPSTFQSDLSSGKIPDGNDMATQRGPVDAYDSIVDQPHDGGFPHPWDCEPAHPYSTDKIDFFPSSGYDNLLGIVEMSNCVSAPNGTWCCPC